VNVLAVVQAWNAHDPIRGFTVPWMEALAERVEHVTVLASEQRQGSTRANITLRSLGRERLDGRFRKVQLLRNWDANMRSLLANDRPDVIFTHMAPVYSLLSYPYARPKRIPIVTWFAHRESSRVLQAAHFASNRVVSINPASYPYRHDRLVPLGHGIDTTSFCPDPEVPPADPPLLVSIGRLSPIKDLGTFVRSIALLRTWGYDVRGAIVGDEPDRDRLYGQEIRDLVGQLQLDDIVQMVGSVPPNAITSWYRKSFAHVNLCPTGALDKAALEAMACGKPSLVANDSYADTLGCWKQQLLFRHGDATDLAEHMRDLLDAPVSVRDQMGIDLRQSVIERHSIAGLADGLVAVFESVTSGAT